MKQAWLEDFSLNKQNSSYDNNPQSSMAILTINLTHWPLTLLKIRLGLRLGRGKLTLTIVGLAKELRLASSKLIRLTTRELTIAITSSIITTMIVGILSPSSIERLIELINCHSQWRWISKIRPFLYGSFFSIEQRIQLFNCNYITSSSYSRTKCIIFWWQSFKS